MLVTRIPGGEPFYYESWMDSRRVSACVDYGSRVNLVTQETMSRHNLQYSQTDSVKSPRSAIDGNGDEWSIIGQTDIMLQVEVGNDTVGFHGFVVRPYDGQSTVPHLKTKTWDVLVGSRLAHTVNYFLFCNPVFY